MSQTHIPPLHTGGTPQRKRQPPFFLTILCTSLACLIILNSLYIHFIENEKITIRKARELDSLLPVFRETKLTLAFYGDSHVLDSVKTPLLPHAYNFGLGGAPYTLLLWQQRKLFKEGITPIISVFQLDPLSFSSKWRSTPYILFDPYFSTQYIPPHILKRYTNLSLPTIYARTYFPIIGEGRNILVFLTTRERKELRMGWAVETGNLSLQNATSIAQREANEHFSPNPNLFEEKTYTAFLTQVREAMQNGSLILLITYPHSREYRLQAEKLGVNLTRFISRVLTDLREAGIPFCYLNYYTLFNTTDVYTDSHHLNAEGADRFTRRLITDLTHGSFTQCEPESYARILHKYSIHILSGSSESS